MRLRSLLIGLATLSLPLLVQGYAEIDTYNDHFFYGEWVPGLYEFFGGCEVTDNTACLDSVGGDTFFNLGAAAVKQGVYTLAGPTFEDGNSRFYLDYDYKFITEEPASSTDDYGMIKVKDVATNTVYYYKTIYPSEATGNSTDSWVHQHVLLPNTITDQQLQLVFEIYNNDDDELSLMHINSIWSQHQSKPVITGTVQQSNDLGKKSVLADATVYLKNKKGTKTLKTTTTDAAGNFTFNPVKANQKFRVEVIIDDKTATEKTDKTTWGAVTYVPVITLD